MHVNFTRKNTRYGIEKFISLGETKKGDAFYLDNILCERISGCENIGGEKYCRFIYVYTGDVHVATAKTLVQPCSKASVCVNGTLYEEIGINLELLSDYCVNNFDNSKQDDILQEEMNELSIELFHDKRGRESHIPEEMAHVLISWLVVAKIRNLSATQLNEEILKKMKKYGVESW